MFALRSALDDEEANGSVGAVVFRTDTECVATHPGIALLSRNCSLDPERAASRS